jgi:hypothetical protein
MALVAAGKTADVDYLKSAAYTKTTDYEAAILALAAAGKNPGTFPDTDFVAALKTFHTDGQIGYATILNDDIFGVLALIAAGEPASDTVVQDAKNFILSNQNSGDGGWSFAVGGGSDTNMTAMAIMALLEAGVSKTDSHITNAVNYLKSAQNNDGGFSYDPQSPYGTSSDASSDAWVISVIYKLGENPANWTKSGNNPISHLLSLQVQQGYFDDGFGDSQFTAISTSYAVIALSGKYYPVGVSSVPSVPNVDYKIEGSAGVLCEGRVNAPDPLELVKLIAPSCGFTYYIQETSYGPYLNRIGNDVATGTTGWLYAVDFVTPNVGAADYDLQNSDYVIWHFGDFDWQPAGAAELNLNVNILPIEGSAGLPGENDSVSFSVNVSGGGNNLSFGDAAPGAVMSQTVTIANLGTNGLYIESVVNGDEVFKNYLNIDNVSWHDFGATLQSGGSKNAEVKLAIPSSYSNPGTKSGKLIFWVKSEQ